MADPFHVGSKPPSSHASSGHPTDPFGVGPRGNPANRGRGGPGGFTKAYKVPFGIVGRTVDDLGHVAVNAPGGIYAYGRAVVHDATHPGAHHTYDLAAGQAKAIPHQLADWQNHPGYAALDVLPAVNAAAKLGEAGALAKAGNIKGAATHLVTTPKPEPRVVKLPRGKQVDAGIYSRAASGRVAQKGLDKLREKYPNVRFGLRNQYERAGFERSQNERVRASLVDAPAKALLAKSKGLNRSQALSIRVAAEGVPLAERIAHTKQFLSEAEGRTANQLRNHLKLLTRAQKYVHDVQGADGTLIPRIKPEHPGLIDVFERARKVANKREGDLLEAGVLKKGTAENRKSAPGEIIRGNKRQRSQATQLELGFNPEHAPEPFHNEGGFFVSYRNAKNPKGLGSTPQQGVKRQIGLPQDLSELRHEFTGATLRTGNIDPNTLRQVADDSMRANKNLALWRQRDDLRKLADDTQLTDHHIPIRPIWLKGKKWPAEIKAAIDGLDEKMTPEEHATLGQKLHDYVFPKKGTVGASAKGVKWIDSRLLDKTNLPGPLVGLGSHTAAKRVFGAVDSVNQAERNALIYLRPGHAITRGANNATFNLIQQGPFAVKNIARSVRQNAELGTDDASRLDAAMGHGYFHSLGNTGPGQKVTAALQAKYEKYVDLPFRRASFFHEAAKFGYKTTDEVKTLLNDPAKEADLIRVAREANNAIIDYGRMGPVERDVVRRVLFIYPWLKGATLYAGKFLRDHPAQAGATGQVGQLGFENQQKELGALPSYLQDVFKVGGSSAYPTVVRPTAINQFGTPADIALALKQFVAGGHDSQHKLSTLVQPFLGALMGGEGGPPVKPGTPAAKSIFESLFTVPGVTYAERLLHPPAKDRKPHIFPYTRGEASSQFFAGSASPHKMNKAAANRAAYSEQHPRR